MQIQYVPDQAIARLARRFVQEHGQAAPALVGHEERKSISEGNLRGAVICRRLVAAIEMLLTMEPNTPTLH